MLHKEEIGSSHNSLTFMVPQVGREITLRFGWMADLSEKFGSDVIPVVKKKPFVYKLNDQLVEIGRAGEVAVYYSNKEDVIAIRKYVYLFFHEGGYYGYTRLNKADCESYLNTYVTERIASTFLVDTKRYVLQVEGRYFILVNPNADGYGYAYLFNNYDDMELEEKLVNDFISKM